MGVVSHRDVLRSGDALVLIGDVLRACASLRAEGVFDQAKVR